MQNAKAASALFLPKNISSRLLSFNATSFCFQAQIAFLQGERKGQENLKKDLVRRIKMLEYALKQERSVLPHRFFTLNTPELFTI